jgi:hypothetical protein
MAAKGFYVNYGSEITFINRIADNIDNTGVSNIDNFISPKDKEFIIKNNEINSRVKVDFLQLDNPWHFKGNNSTVLKSIKPVNI